MPAEPLAVPAATSALLIADFYPVVTTLEHGRARDVLPRTQGLIAGFRARGVPILFCATTFREGHPEISPRNPLFAPKLGTAAGPLDPAAHLHPEIVPEPGDILFAKRRVSAFHATELDLILRAKGVETLFLCGFATRGVVLSTVRQGADLDYRLAVIEDCCVERDAETHDLLMEKVLPMQAAILSAEAALAALTD